MNIFFDMEFTGLHQNTTLISFGACDEQVTGKNFYRELSDYNENQVDSWIQENVLRYIGRDADTPISREQLRADLEEWLSSYNEQIIMWGDCLAYDWILFCELWGGALHVPDYIHYIPRDICTLFAAKGVDPDVSRVRFAGLSDAYPTHHALGDAQLIRHCYNKLLGYYTNPDVFDEKTDEDAL